MSRILFLTWIIIAGVIFFVPPIASADVKDGKNATSETEKAATDTAIYDQVKETLSQIVGSVQGGASTETVSDEQKAEETSPQSEQEKKEVPLPARVPVYRPPIRGAPVGRVAGGTRGIIDEYPSLLCVISPDHTALTIRSQPQLHWYLREKTTYLIELTVIEEMAIHPILETRIAQPVKPGIQTIQLSDFDVRLEQGVTYKWFVAVIPDPDRRSKDILAWGAVRYVRVSEETSNKLTKIDKETVLDIYARAGIWYDAFADLTDLIEANPNDSNLVAKQKALLEQIGLPQISQ